MTTGGFFMPMLRLTQTTAAENRYQIMVGSKQ
jgi:hypothetical protein